MARKRMTDKAETLMHRSCRHVSDGMLVIVNTDGIVTVTRAADQWEREALTSWGKLCFANKENNGLTQ